jgi:hypothetical protein
MGVQFAGNILVQSNGAPLPIVNGGTGQTSAQSAINALLPTQATNAGKVLTTNGTDVSWTTASGGGTPGGADTQIQFNDAGTFGGSSNFVINKSTGALTAASTFTNIGLIVSNSVTSRSLKYQTSGTDRWILETDATAESLGTQAGSNFALIRVADNGSTTNQVFTISRATGVLDFKTIPTINGSAVNAASALTGTTLASNVVSSSLTTVGTLVNLTVTNTITGSISGNAATATTATSATTATNIAGGTTGNVTYQSGAGATSFVTNAAGVLQAATSGATPAWTTTPTLTGTNFSGTAASLSIGGNAATATSAATLTTPRTINGVSFNGSANITVTADANTLSGTTLASGVTGSSLTSVGTLTSLAVTGAITKGGLDVGYLTVPLSSNTTTDLTDSGKFLYSAAGGTAFSINGSLAYPVGTAITFVNKSSTACTITITTDTMTLAGTTTTTLPRTLGTYGMATALKVASGQWIISGTGLT